jgi:hypothetical protein
MAPGLNLCSELPISTHQPPVSAVTRSAAMSIKNITSPDRASLTSTSMESTPGGTTAASAASVASAVAASASALDRLTQQSPPARFPWLNRLSHELELAARRRSAFSAAPTIGDSLDQSA